MMLDLKVEVAIVLLGQSPGLIELCVELTNDKILNELQYCEG